MVLKEEKYQATLLGCALGDTLGMAVEGWKKQQIVKYVGRITEPRDPVLLYDAQGELLKKDEFGKLKYYTKDLKKGQYTDDTILTVALAESLVAVGFFSIFDIADRQLAEYTKRLREDGTVIGGFGGTTIAGFKNLLAGYSPLESGVIGGPGNAPAMKMSPLGLYMDARNDYREGLLFADSIGRITHLDPRSLASGIVQAHAVYSMLQSVSRYEFIESCLDVCQRYERRVTPKFPLHKKGSMASRLQWIVENKDATPAAAHKKLGSGSVVMQSYPFALFMVQRYWDEPLEGLLELVNFGGDCDTTGAMYGALTGARQGDIFPQEWKNVLENQEYLLSLGTALHNL